MANAVAVQHARVAAIARWEHIVAFRVGDWPYTVEADARVYLSVMRKHVNCGLCEWRGQCSVALCCRQLRQFACVGTLGVGVSVPGATLGSRHTRGLQVERGRRLLLWALVVDEIVPPWLYFGRQGWSEFGARPDRAYTASVEDAGPSRDADARVELEWLQAVSDSQWRV